MSMDSNYDAQAITVLEGLDPVRKRPGMYIGSTGQRGLHHLVFEIVDNSVDESLAGHCTHIDVTLHADGSIEVGDNGRGIPCSLHPTTGKSALETVLCVLHAGGKFGGDDSGYKVSGGLHGVGISVVNALSTTMSVRVTRDNKLHSMSFAEGVPQGGLQVDPATDASTRGTRVWFQPDPKIFKTTLEFDFDKLSSRLDELAYLNAGLTISLTDRRSADGVGKDGDLVRAETYRHDGGIDELVREMCNEKVQLHPDMEVISVKDERKGVAVEVAMRWSKDMYTDTMVGFANSIRTSDGGYVH
jgi:DNA gyrase subunit B